VRVERAVAAVLARDHRQVLARHAVALHVDGCVLGEQVRRAGAARMPPEVRHLPALGNQARPRRDVAHLLDAEHEHDVVDAGGDRERRVADRVAAPGAGVLDPRDRLWEEAQRVGEARAGDRLAANQPAERRRQPGSFESRRVDSPAGALETGAVGVARKLLVAGVEALAEGRHASGDD
jgi:hypothetical protein